MSTEKHREEWHIMSYVPVSDGNSMLDSDSLDSRLMQSFEGVVRRKCEAYGMAPVSELSISKWILSDASDEWRGVVKEFGFMPAHVLVVRGSVWLEKAN